MLRNFVNNAMCKANFRQRFLSNKYKNMRFNHQNGMSTRTNLDLEVNRIVWFDLEVRHEVPSLIL